MPTLLITSLFLLHFVSFVLLTIVDISAIANQDGLSALEVEMRKLEGVVKEVVDELGYLKEREVRFQSTNGKLLYVVILSR